MNSSPWRERRGNRNRNLPARRRLPGLWRFGLQGSGRALRGYALQDALKELVLQGAAAVEIKAEAIRLGMRTLRRSGVRKICEGVTSVEEIARITAAD